MKESKLEQTELTVEELAKIMADIFVPIDTWDFKEEAQTLLNKLHITRRVEKWQN